MKNDTSQKFAGFIENPLEQLSAVGSPFNRPYTGDIAVMYKGRHVGQVEQSDGVDGPLFFAHSWVDEGYEAVWPTFEDAEADVKLQAERRHCQRKAI